MQKFNLLSNCYIKCLSITLANSIKSNYEGGLPRSRIEIDPTQIVVAIVICRAVDKSHDQIYLSKTFITANYNFRSNEWHNVLGTPKLVPPKFIPRTAAITVGELRMAGVWVGGYVL